MKRFIIRLIIFLLPLLMFTVPPGYILLKSGENFKSVDKMISDSQPYLIGYAYNQNNYRYIKWKRIDSDNRFNVIALGSSRVLQFRSEMFNTSFYNAGYTISSVDDFLPFLESLSPDKYPEILIIGLDQWMFNKTWNDRKTARSRNSWSESFARNPTLETLMKVWEDLSKGKYSLLISDHTHSATKIGLNAILYNNGIRNDGSMRYGDQITKLLRDDSTANDYDYRDTFNRIDKGENGFEFGNEVDTKTLSSLERLLRFCKLHKIQVIGILLPFAEGVFEKMLKSGKHTYLNNIAGVTELLFNKYQYEFHNLNSVTSCNSNDSETLDGFHGSEMTYIKMLIKMLESGSQLNQVSNVEDLKNAITQPLNRYEVYKPLD